MTIKTQRLTGKKNCLKYIQSLAKKHKKLEIGFLHKLKTFNDWQKHGYHPEKEIFLVFRAENNSVICMWEEA